MSELFPCDLKFQLNFIYFKLYTKVVFIVAWASENDFSNALMLRYVAQKKLTIEMPTAIEIDRQLTFSQLLSALGT